MFFLNNLEIEFCKIIESCCYFVHKLVKLGLYKSRSFFFFESRISSFEEMSGIGLSNLMYVTLAFTFYY
jgi:hypothetical protein